MRSCSVCLIVVWVLGSFGCVSSASAEKTGTVYVSFWFDTEDFILPEADDAAKRVAKIFSDRNIKLTFKMVGEKVRVLEVAFKSLARVAPWLGRRKASR